MSRAPRRNGTADGGRIGRLYREHFAWLVRVLGARFGRDDAEDLAQDVYLRLAASTPEEVFHPKTFLLRVAASAAVDRHRRATARTGGRSTLALDLLLEEPGCDPDQEMAILYRQVLLSMPVPLRDTFLLNRAAGLSYPQIAERLGISVKAVEARMSKALTHCTMKLRD